MSLPFQFRAAALVRQKRTTQAAIDSVKTWLNGTALPQLSEEFITLFLLSCANNIDHAQRTIEWYFKTKNAAPQIYDKCDLNGEELTKALKVVGFCVIPERMEGNTGIIMTRLDDHNYRNVDVVALLKICAMLAHLIQIRDPPDDVILVVDLKGVGFMHLTCVKMKAMIQHLEYVQEAMPLRVKEIHVFNTNYIFERAIGLFRAFIKSELLENMKTFPPGLDMRDYQKKHIPAEFLPKDYDGKLPELKSLMEETVGDLRDAQTFFRAEEQLRRGCQR